MLIPRYIGCTLKKALFKSKVVVLFGARQVGKTTEVKNLIQSFPKESLYLNGELISIQERLSVREAVTLKSYLGNKRLIVIDEAQKVPHIGDVLKILVDTYPEIQIVATGSSSFNLAGQIGEPLTGRVNQFILYPLSLGEIENQYGRLEAGSKLENIMRFGSYPEIFLSSEHDAQLRLNEISSNYLYKDILSFDDVKKSPLIIDLLKLLALQLGQEVSYNELAVKLGVSRQTIQKYIYLLEQSFVLFTLRAFSRNLRKEISKSVKIYFYDLGIRNSLIQNHNPLALRADVGALWENLMILEKIKTDAYQERLSNRYFWRTYGQQEIDYVEERGGTLHAFEFKWSEKHFKIPGEFAKTYPNTTFHVVNQANYWEFLNPKQGELEINVQ